MHIIIRYSEIALKGKNRGSFENRLVLNIRDCLDKHSVTHKVTRVHGRIYAEASKRCPHLARIFGIASFSHATKLPFDIEEIKKEVWGQINGMEYKTFRISAQRLDKAVALSSREINELLGRFVVEKGKKRVSLNNPDLDIGVETRGNVAYVFTDHIPGPGGLPLGSMGKALALMEDEKSVLAAWMVMRRGVRVFPVGKRGIRILERYNYGFEPMKPVELTKKGIIALVSGQTLAEVADIETRHLVLRPLVGMTDDEIGEKLKSL
jgi:tRNA uracil 4-sulfurtransferase